MAYRIETLYGRRLGHSGLRIGHVSYRLCLELFDPGSHFVCSEDLYGGSVRIFETVDKSRGLSFTYVNTSHQELMEQALT